MLTSIPTEQQIRELQTDWLKGTRDENTFVHKGELSIKRVTNEKDFSTYFTGHRKSVEICHARNTAQKVVNSMTKERVKVILHQDMSCTTGKQIFVATKHFDDKNLTTGEKFDILLGFAIHEAGHVNSTMFDIEKKYERYGGFRTRFPGPLARIAKNIDNIIEDERTEAITGEEMSGFADFLSCAKKYAFGKYSNSPIPINNDKIADFLNALLIAIRFTASLDRDTVIRNYELLEKSKKILTPYPKTNEDVARATVLITDEIVKTLKQENNQDDSQNDEEQSQDTLNEEDETKEREKDNREKENKQSNSCPDSEAEDQKNREKENTNDQEKDTNDGNDENEENTPYRAPDIKNISDKLNSTAVNEILARIEEISDINAQGSESEIMRSKTLSSIAEGTNRAVPLKYINKDQSFILQTTERNPSVYRAALSRIRNYIPAVKKALECHFETRTYKLRGESSGKLNTNKLAMIATGQKNLFTAKDRTKCEKISVCLLIDESMSMSNGRQKAAMETAILIAEAVKSIPAIEMSAYGFTTGIINVYMEKQGDDRTKLGSITAEDCTPTGTAIRIVGKIVRERTNAPCLMLVLTDGEPDNTNECISATKELEKQNFHVIGIGIQSAEAVKKCFTQHIVVNNLNELAPTLGKLVKKQLSGVIRY